VQDLLLDHLVGARTTSHFEAECLGEADRFDLLVLIRSPTGALNCTYDSWEQGEHFIRGRPVGGGCVENPEYLFGSDNQAQAQAGRKAHKSRAR
jgi:hypothetical protein